MRADSQVGKKYKFRWDSFCLGPHLEQKMCDILGGTFVHIVDLDLGAKVATERYHMQGRGNLWTSVLQLRPFETLGLQVFILHIVADLVTLLCLCIAQIYIYIYSQMYNL